MSSSALIAARKRLEASLKKYEIPTTLEPTTDCKSGVLLLSLLTSRLNWTSSVFSKYKADPIQQPKRTNNARKKWPNMKYLSSGTLVLGPHVFENTLFYEATRWISWLDIAKQQGFNVPQEDVIMTETAEAITTDVNITEAAPVTTASTTTATTTEEKLKLIDIVFEIAEMPNERFIFPKEIIMSLSVEKGPIVVHASFLLPIDPIDYFFESSKDQILKFGNSCQLPFIQEFIKLNKETYQKKDTTIYQPTNLCITQLDQTTIDAMEDVIYPSNQVRNSMLIKMKNIPKKTFIKYDLSQDSTNLVEVQDLLKRSLTVPEIAIGPIMAEKKRNEILNQIRLGKRPRDEKFESELPKNKYSNQGVKEEVLLKCAYCSTKHTAMWRPGPGGHGTLCNSCGIQWKRGEILKGALVISIEEEKQLLKEKRERERLAEALDLEKVDRENKKVVVQQQDGIDLTNKKFAAQLLSKRQNNKTNIPSKSSTPEPSTAASSPAAVVIDAVEKKKNIVAPTSLKIQPAPALVAQQHQQTQQQTQQPAPTQPSTQLPTQNSSFFLYTQGGIPLPTLSIDFVGLFKFVHPNCAVTLLDSHFHIRLCTQTGEQSLIHLEKSDLIDSSFIISQEGDANAPREVLTMTIPPLTNSIDIFKQSLPATSKITFTIKFLEKLDPTGGAVVQRIIQRWLCV